MRLHHGDERVTLYHGDAIEVLASLPDNSVDSVVTDPPYDLTNRTPDVLGCIACGRTLGGRDGTPDACPRCGGELTRQRSAQGKGFMGKEWDGTGIAFRPDVWVECLRVLRPGGHLLSFGGSRTWHRLACAVEDAGFEVRDSIAWLYGSGFPKSLDVSKAIDKAAPRYEMFGPFAAHYAERRVAAGLNHREVCEAGKFYLTHNKGGASVNWEKGYNVPTLAQWATLAPLLGLSDEFLPLIERIEAERDVTGRHLNAITTGDAGLTARGEGKERRDTPATPYAERWQGWGTALKPAFEPVVVARKPLSGTVAQTVLAHGTGALNIDGCRVGETVETWPKSRSFTSGISAGYTEGVEKGPTQATGSAPAGRWPANVLLDDSQAAELDRQSGERPGDSPNRKPRFDNGADARGVYGKGWAGTEAGPGYTGSGGASRFFPTFRYEAKAPSSERPRIARNVLRLRADLTPAQVDHVRARLTEAGVQVD